MSDVEELVRRSMRDVVGDPPAMEDTAGRAITGAHRVRRRRSLVGVGAVTFALVLVVGGLVVVRDGGAPENHPQPATRPPNPTGSPVAAIVNERELLLPDGRRITPNRLSYGVTGGYQVPDGWVLSAPLHSLTYTLWLVRPDGSTHRLVDRMEGPAVVAPGGRGFAWRIDERIYVGRLNPDATMSTESSTAIGTRAYPLAYTGTVVVLGYSQTGGGIDTFDTWLPARGPYVPGDGHTRHVIAVFGPAPDRTSLLGLVHAAAGSKEPCLARLDPADHLRTKATACGVANQPDAHGPVSPDGRWIALRSLSAEGLIQLSVVDLSTVFERPVIAYTWDSPGPGVWLNNDSLVAPDRGGRPTVFHIGSRAPEPYIAPGIPAGGPLEFVPRVL